jgi:hypothetical protein
MAIVYRNIPALTGAATADVPSIGLSNFKKVKSVTSRDESTVRTDHVFNVGVNADKTTLTARHEVVASDPKRDIEEQTRFSLRLMTPVEDATLDEPDLGWSEVVIAMNYSGTYVQDNAQLARQLLSLVKAAIGDFSGVDGSPITTTIANASIGRTETPWV